MKITRKQLRKLIIESNLPEDHYFESDEDYYHHIGELIHQGPVSSPGSYINKSNRKRQRFQAYRMSRLIEDIAEIYPGFVPDIDLLIEEDYLSNPDPNPEELNQAQYEYMRDRLIGYWERETYDNGAEYNPWYWIGLGPDPRTRAPHSIFRILDLAAARRQAGYA